LQNRFHASIEDVEFVARPALRHRIVLNFEGQADDIGTDSLIEGLLDKLAQTSADARA
jgi:MoxR-like ATPase